MEGVARQQWWRMGASMDSIRLRFDNRVVRANSCIKEIERRWRCNACHITAQQLGGLYQLTHHEIHCHAAVLLTAFPSEVLKLLTQLTITTTTTPSMDSLQALAIWGWVCRRTASITQELLVPLVVSTRAEIRRHALREKAESVIQKTRHAFEKLSQQHVPNWSIWLYKRLSLGDITALRFFFRCPSTEGEEEVEAEAVHNKEDDGEEQDHTRESAFRTLCRMEQMHNHLSFLPLPLSLPEPVPPL